MIGQSCTAPDWMGKASILLVPGNTCIRAGTQRRRAGQAIERRLLCEVQLVSKAPVPIFKKFEPGWPPGALLSRCPFFLRVHSIDHSASLTCQRIVYDFEYMTFLHFPCLRGDAFCRRVDSSSLCHVKFFVTVTSSAVPPTEGPFLRHPEASVCLLS